MAYIDKVVEKLENQAHHFENECADTKRANVCYNAIQTIEELQSQIPKWHYVSEGDFPEDYENVLVDYEYFRYGDYNCMFRTVGIAYYSHEYDMWHVEGGGHQIKVQAWMELPNFESEGE